jgi:DNA-binding transcriptional regulator YhcF (GntR family)
MEFKNTKSIFLQIADNLVERMMNGTHPPGEKIPSVREFAAEMGVNPNTILRTYNDLQMRQIIENKRGIGYYVTPDAQEKIMAWKKDEFFTNELPGIIRQMTMLGITYSDLKPYFETVSNTDNNENRE